MAKFSLIPDKEKHYQAYMVYILTIIWSVVTGVIVAFGFYFLPENWHRWLTFFCISLFIAIFNLTLNGFGFVRFASWSLTVMIWLYITIPCYTAGGIMSIGILSQMSVILTAGFLLGWRGGLFIGLLTIGTDFTLAYLEYVGRLPVSIVHHNPITRWISAIIPFGTLLALQYYATNHLRTGLIALQREIKKREEAEQIKEKIVYDLGERVKELKTLYTVSNILQNEDIPTLKQFSEIAEVIPRGWQYPEITSARVSIGGIAYTSENFVHSEHFQQAEMRTAKGTLVNIEVGYAKAMPQSDIGPFLKEEGDLIAMLTEMLKTKLDREERKEELKDYKYALDIGYIVSISSIDGEFLHVNENFCKISGYSREELIGSDHSILWSGVHSIEYFNGLDKSLKEGKTYSGEFCNAAKDGTLYWVDSTVVPFFDENGTVYQYLAINYDITERKEAEEKIKQSEQLLRKITSQVPGNTYMFEIKENGSADVLFMNRGSDPFNHEYALNEVTENAQIFEELIHDDDKMRFYEELKKAYQTQSPISFQYRVVVNGNINRWRWIQAIPEAEKTGKTIWYGSTSDITPLVEYIVSIEQIIFDIGHVIRRPISNMLAMTNLILDKELDSNEIKELSLKLNHISKEMDKFIKELNQVYQQKKQENQNKIDVSFLINKRGSLFE